MLMQFINLRGKTASVGTAVGPRGGRSSGRCRAAGGSASFSERCSACGSLNFLVDHKHCQLLFLGGQAHFVHCKE